jgi:ketosteroid isomerase-like protein
MNGVEALRALTGGPRGMPLPRRGFRRPFGPNLTRGLRLNLSHDLHLIRGPSRLLSRTLHLAPALLLVAALLQGCGGDRDGEGPRALVEDWVAMWNTYDLDRVGDLFLDEPGLTYFSSEREGVIRGMAALVEHHGGFGFIPGGTQQPNRLWVEDLGVDLFGDAAVLTGIWYFQRGGDDDVAAPLQRGPVTFVALFRDSRWWFVHMHFANYPAPGYLPPEGG